MSSPESGWTGASCPKCGGVVRCGYGLMGGGMGAYTFCETDGCDFFDKVQDEEDMPPAPAPAKDRP